VTNKGEAPGQVDEVATLLPSGRRPTCLPNIDSSLLFNSSLQRMLHGRSGRE
jgi:hypothetical protein